MIQIGDIVAVLDEAITGRVEGVEGNQVLLRDQDGFPMRFLLQEVVKVANQDTLYAASTGKIKEIIKQKEQPQKRKPSALKIKRSKEQPPMEVDLHIHKLVKSIKGMSNYDMMTLQLETAERQLDFARRKRISKIVFIHGVGQGVLKAELEYLFRRQDGIKFYDADYKKYGLGALEVYIFQKKR